MEGLMGSYDGYVYPEWSGLNDDDKSLSVEDALKHAINSVRYIWRESGEQRASKEVLARHITGSECISLLFALEGAIRMLPPAQPPA
jgi:hypothetical protein